MNEPTFRALSLGELLDKAFSIYRRQFPLLISIVAAVLIPAALLQVLGILYFGEAQVLTSLPQGFLQLLAQVALVAAISNIYLGREVSFRSAFSEGSKRYWSVWGARFLMGLAIGLPVGILFACLMVVSYELGLIAVLIALIPAIFFSTRWSLAAPAILMENIGASEGLKRSWELTNSYFWRVLGTSFVAGLLTIFLNYLPILLSEYIFTTFLDVPYQVVEAVNTTITQATLLISLPFSMAVIVLIYYDLRIRKEAFDLQRLAESVEETAMLVPAGS